MATVNTQDYVPFEDKDVLIEGKEYRGLKIKFPDKRISLRDSTYLRTNFFIKQLNINNKKNLPTYWYFRWMRWVFVVFLIISIPGPFVHFYYALISLFLMLPWLFVSTQHIHVIRKSLPKLLKEPPVKMGKILSTIASVTQVNETNVTVKDKNTNLEMAFVYVAGQKIQIISEKGHSAIKSTRIYSLIMFILTVIVIFGCLISLIVFATLFVLGIKGERIAFCSTHSKSCIDCTSYYGDHECVYAFESKRCIGKCYTEQAIPDDIVYYYSDDSGIGCGDYCREVEDAECYGRSVDINCN